MIREFPHYSDAAVRSNLKYIRGKFGYKGESFWWHLLEWLNQHDAEPVDLNDPLLLFSTCEYLHPLEYNPDKREVEVLEFLEFCAQFHGRDGETLIDPALWQERKVWSSKNFEKQQRILKRRKGDKDPAPPEVTAFTKQMHYDLIHIFGIHKSVKWNHTWDANVIELLKNASMEDIQIVWRWLVEGKDSNAIWWRNPIQSPNALRKHFTRLFSLATRSKPTIVKKSIFEEK